MISISRKLLKPELSQSKAISTLFDSLPVEFCFFCFFSVSGKYLTVEQASLMHFVTDLSFLIFESLRPQT